MKARDIMTAGPMTVVPNDSVRRVADVMQVMNVGAVPVVEDSQSRLLRGIITDRDLVIRCMAEGHIPMCPVREHMTPLPLETALPDDDVQAVIEKMERAQVRRIPVVTTEGVLVGIIAQADIATKLGPSAPEEVEELLERVSALSVPAA